MAIIKNPLIIVQSGGSGCYILITSLAGATLTCGSQTYTLGASETYHAFAVNAGTYTCTATKGTLSKTESVTVSSGVTPITLNPSRLPSGYQEVEYLQSTGAQYISTITDVLSGTQLDIDFDLSSGYLWGVIGGTGVNDLHWLGSDEVICADKWSTRAATSVLVGRHQVRTIFGGAFTLDGDVITTFSSTLSLSGCNIGLFATLRTYTESRVYSSAKVYSASLYSSLGDKIRDFVPCYRTSDSKPGMYDLVNNVFYTNQSTGADFTVGPDV